MDIVVSGVGMVSALGIGVEENIARIRKGESGVSASPSVLRTRNALPVGELKRTNRELAALLGVEDRPVSRTALLGAVAAEEALDSALLQGNSRVGLVSSTSVGGMDLSEEFFPEFMRDENKGRLRYVRMHDCAASTDFIAEHCRISGYRTTLSTACSSAANAIMAGCRILKHGMADAVVAGGIDALSRFTLNGFKSLQILDDRLCRPFDDTRSGLNLGEGAGYLVLQREGDAKRAYCRLSGYANRNDAFHQTASSEDGEGAFLAMKAALEKAGLSPADIGYLNVHGTGTPNNDLTEGRAVRRLFGDRIPPFSSTKAFTGHALAAAGGIEAVLCALSIQRGFLYPNLNFRKPMHGLDLYPLQEFRVEAGVDHVLSNSLGFWGNCATLVFSR